MTGLRRAIVFATLPLLLLPAFETALWLADVAARGSKGETARKVSRKLAPLDPYPERPEEYLKIAVFGESAAAGYGGLRGFDALLRRELETRYPGQKLLVKNFAAPGHPFHGFQVELLKAEMDRYDVLLVYSGLAESMRYADEAGLFRPAAEKSARGLKPFGWKERLRRFLERESRAYSFYSRLRGLRDAFLGAPAPLVHCNRFQVDREELQAALFPSEEKDRFVADYARDMKEVAALAARKRKHVLVAGVIVMETSMPHFSVLAPGTTPEQVESLRTLLSQGTALINAGRHAQALEPLSRAIALDPGVAIVDYRLGQAYWSLGRRAQARRHFKLSAENDGLPFRHVGRLNAAAAMAEAAGAGWFRYIDTDPGLGALVDRDYRYDELFNDMEHPRLAGHAFLAQEFLCRLPGLPHAPPCADWRVFDLRALTERYRRELKVSTEEEAGVAMMMAQWHFTNASMTAYPEERLAAAEAHLDEHRRKAGDAPAARASALLLQAWIDGARGEGPRRPAALLNEALALEPAFVRAQWLADSGNGRSMEEMFRDYGVSFEAVGRRFTSRSEEKTTDGRAGNAGSGTARRASPASGPAALRGS